MKDKTFIQNAFVIAILLLLSSKFVKAQPQISLIETDPYNLRLSSVINFQLIPDLSSVNAEIKITLKSLIDGELAYEAIIPKIEIFNSPILVNTMFNGYQTTYQNPKFINNDLIRFGRYQLCVALILKSRGNEKMRECLEITSLPTNPPILVSPFDNATISELNPLLTWLPPTPINPNWVLRYHLKLTEIQSNQTPVEALKTNLPIYENANLSALSLIYPYGGIPLAYDKNYAWSISAYDTRYLVGNTEIWQFKLVKDSLEKIRENFRMMSFSILEANPSGESYTTGNYFCIQFNPCSDITVPLEIYQNSVQGKPIAYVDFSSLLNIGDNKYVIDLKQLKGIKTSERYTLMYRCNGNAVKLNFQFIK
jgi:hypothetical protein